MTLFEPRQDYRGLATRAPDWITPAEIGAEAAAALTPPSRIMVHKAAEEVRRIYGRGTWAPYDNARAPYMIEPQEQLTSRRFRGLVFAGPARCSKSAALIENPVAHAIRFDPKPVHIVHMTFNTARRYMNETIGPMIATSPELASRLRQDNALEKTFRGGARVTVGWPVASELSGRTVRLMLLTDYDHLPLDVGGEGSPFLLAMKRTQTEGSGAMTVAEGSPAHEMPRGEFVARTPHEAPRSPGVLTLYNDGTRARYYYRCKHCGELFDPRFERLEYDRKLPTPKERGATAVLVCPHSGCVMKQSDRRELNAGGVWLHETSDGGVAPLGPETRRADVVSYHLSGVVNWAMPWADLVARYEAAVAKKNELGDDTDYRTVFNVDLGLPVPNRADDGEDTRELSVDYLRARAVADTVGVAPAWARFISVGVDTQKARWVWQAVAWGEGMRAQVIDRGEIFKAPGGERAVDPARRVEDWKALEALRSRRYPVAGTDYEMRPLCVACDMQGEKGVTERARAFWRDRKAVGEGDFWLMLRGRGGYRHEKRWWRSRPERANKNKTAQADVPILNLAVDRLKDTVFSMLTCEEPGPLSMALPAGLPVEVFEELCAEIGGVKGWEKRPGVKRNEAFDLCVYAYGGALAYGADRVVDWSAAPAWATLSASNPYLAPAPATRAKAQGKQKRRRQLRFRPRR